MGSTSMAIAYPTGVAAGRLAIIHGSVKLSSSTWGAVSGWTLIGEATGGTGTSANDAGTTRVGLWARVLDGTETGSVTVTNTGGVSCAGAMTILSNATGSWDYATFVTGADTTHGANWSATCGAWGSALAANDWVYVANSTDTDIAQSITAPALTQTGATFGTFTLRNRRLSTTGTDSGAYAWTASVTTGSSNAPTWTHTSTTSTCGATIVARIREVTPPVSPKSITSPNTPNQLVGLAGWYRAGSGAGVASNDPVDLWPDQSGNNRDLAQTDTTKQPTYQTAVVNGKPVIRFDGTTDVLVATRTSETTIWLTIVARRRTATVNGARLLMLRPEFGTSGFGGPEAGSVWNWFLNEDSTVRDLGGTVTNWTILTVVLASPSSATIWRDGAFVATFDPIDHYTSNPALVVGAATDAAPVDLPGDYDVAEIFYYNRVPAERERSELHSYLQDEYGITVADYTAQLVGQPTITTTAPAGAITFPGIPAPGSYEDTYSDTYEAEVNQPTVTGGTQTVVLQGLGIPSAEAIPAPTVTVPPTSPAPATVAATASAPAVTVAAGAVPTPTTVAATAGVPAAAVVVSAAAAPATVAGTAAVSSPTAAAGATATPATIAATATVPAVTIQAGAVATPATVVVAAAVPAPVVQAGNVPAPTTVAAAAAIPAVAVETGATLLAAAVAAAASVPAVTVAAGSVVTPDTVAASVTVPAPTVTTGGRDVSDWSPVVSATTQAGTPAPATVSGVMAIPAVTVQAGAVATPTTASAVAAIQSVILEAGVTLAPATVGAAAAVPAPTVVTGNVPAPATVTAVASVGAATVTTTALVTPATVGAVASVPAAAVAAGAVSTPATVTATAGVPAVGVVAGVTLAPATVASTSTVPTVTVVTGNAPTPQTVTAVTTVGAATAQTGATATAATVTSTAAIPAPAVIAVTQAAPPTVAATASIATPTITTTAVVLPGTVQAVAAVPAPAVTIGATASPATVAGTAAVPTPTMRLSAEPVTVTAVAAVSATLVQTGVLLLAATVAVVASVGEPVVVVAVPARGAARPVNRSAVTTPGRSSITVLDRSEVNLR
jgi:hypothetical protein